MRATLAAASCSLRHLRLERRSLVPRLLQLEQDGVETRLLGGLGVEDRGVPLEALPDLGGRAGTEDDAQPGQVGALLVRLGDGRDDHLLLGLDVRLTLGHLPTCLLQRGLRGLQLLGELSVALAGGGKLNARVGQNGLGRSQSRLR